MRDPSLVRFRAVVAGALAHLQSRRQEINDLNVFPVADGDTGDNMALTLNACLAELDRLASIENRSIDEIGRDEIVEQIARAALLGARGNSGVILSQLIRGAAEELVSRQGELIDPLLVGAAMMRGAQRAYGSVRQPVEGTMLTVARDMAAAVFSELAHMPDLGVEPGSDADVQNAILADILEKALQAGEASVRRTPDLLPALKDAGVVDSGGHAITIIFAGVIAALRGTDGPEVERFAPPARVTHPEHASSTFRYCTNFAVTGTQLDAQRWVDPLEQLGDSVLVVGDSATLRVHIHTDDPDSAMALMAEAGHISHQEVADMFAQVAERDARLASAAEQKHCGVLAVVSGDGIAALFASMGADILDGGPTLNPSTAELLEGLARVPSAQVVLLPNSGNVLMAAERAAELSDKDVQVVASKSQQAGLAAVYGYAEDRDAAANADEMRAELEAVRTGGVAPAAKADPSGRFAVGDAIGYVEDELVAWGGPQETLRHVMTALSEDAELLTLIAGQGAPLDRDAIEDLVDGDVELEQSHGGQPSWWWLLSAQ